MSKEKKTENKIEGIKSRFGLKRKDKPESIHDNPFIEQTLRENQNRANHMCSIIFWVVSIIEALNVAMTAVGFFKVSSSIAPLIINVDVLLIIIAINKLGEAGEVKANTLKKLNLIGIISSTLFLDYTLNYNVALAIAVPIIMSALYFERHTVINTAITTILAFGVETYIASSRTSIIDRNHISLPEGTVLVINTNLKDAILEAGFDRSVYVEHMMLLAFLPKLLLLIVIIAIAFIIAKYGQEMLLRQASVSAEHTRIDTELSIANQIQANALPLVDDLNGKYNFELAASMNVTRETGGDFYDFSMLDENHLALVIADVCDKGVPAAMFMMAAKARLNSAFSIDRSPAEILAMVNDSLCQNNAENMFVTVWLGIIDLRTGVMLSANAGHDNPIVGNGNGDFVEIREKHGMFLGEFEDLTYKENRLQLESGDFVYLYTDGVTEAFNSDKEQYGMGRLTSVLNDKCNANMSAQELMNEVKNDIHDFVGNMEQSDDITMLVMKML